MLLSLCLLWFIYIYKEIVLLTFLLKMKNRNILDIIILIFIISSCTQNKNEQNFDQTVSTQNKNEQKRCDSIIYELPKKTTEALFNLLKNKNVSRCGLLESEDKTYIFSFEYDDKAYFTERDSLLFEKTNTFLKVIDKYYPIVSNFDYLFSDIPIKENVLCNGFSHCYIEVDNQGNLIKTFAF